MSRTADKSWHVPAHARCHIPAIFTIKTANRTFLLATMCQEKSLITLPREIIDEVLSYLTKSADLVCLALTHTLFLTIYKSSRASHIERTYDCVRTRLDRDIPVLYYCTKCNCANIPCLWHVLDSITISLPLATFQKDRAQHDALMGYIHDEWRSAQVKRAGLTSLNRW